MVFRHAPFLESSAVTATSSDGIGRICVAQMHFAKVFSACRVLTITKYKENKLMSMRDHENRLFSHFPVD